MYLKILKNVNRLRLRQFLFIYKFFLLIKVPPTALPVPLNNEPGGNRGQPQGFENGSPWSFSFFQVLQLKREIRVEMERGQRGRRVMCFFYLLSMREKVTSEDTDRHRLRTSVVRQLGVKRSRCFRMIDDITITAFCF